MGGPWCEHGVLVRTTTFRDVLRDYWRMFCGRPPLSPHELSGPLMCLRCGQVRPESDGEGGMAR